MEVSSGEDESGGHDCPRSVVMYLYRLRKLNTNGFLALHYEARKTFA